MKVVKSLLGGWFTIWNKINVHTSSLEYYFICKIQLFFHICEVLSMILVDSITVHLIAQVTPFPTSLIIHHP